MEHEPERTTEDLPEAAPGFQRRIPETRHDSLLLHAVEKREDMLRRRAELAGEIEMLLARHAPGVLNAWSSNPAPLPCACDVSEIVAELAWVAHYFDGGMEEPDIEQLWNHYCILVCESERWKHIDLDSNTFALLVTSLCHDSGLGGDSQRYAELLGRVKALDFFLHEPPNPQALPCYDDIDVERQSLYVDMASGPTQHSMQYLFAHGRPTRRPVRFIDTSPFVRGDFEEGRTLFGFSNDEVDLIPVNGMSIADVFPAESIRTLNLDNVGWWIHSDDPTWYAKLGNLVSPRGGRIVVSMKTWWPDALWPEVHGKKDLLEMFHVLLSVIPAEEEVRNSDIVLHCFTQLVEGYPGVWSFSMGSVTSNGSFIEGMHSEDADRGRVQRRTFVFTRTASAGRLPHS